MGSTAVHTESETTPETDLETDPVDHVHPDRLALLSAAVELQVDEDEVGLRSDAERRLWRVLTEEFETFVARIGPVWTAEQVDDDHC
jgi:hypothetical protein